MSDKNYSLLRPFDLEAAKRGEAICYIHFMLVVEFVGEATAIGCIATKEKDGRIAITPRSQFRLAPLCWVEGRPVYKGDVLWAKPHIDCDCRKHEVAEVRDGVVCCEQIYDTEGQWLTAGSLTWTPPNVKRGGYTLVQKASVHGKKADAESFLRLLGEPERWVVCAVEWEEQP